MWEQQTGSLLVMDGGRLAGIITERDVVRAVAEGVDLDTTPSTSVMSRDVHTVAPWTRLDEAAGIMASRWIRHLPVVEDGRVVGVVSLRALAAALATLGRHPAEPATQEAAAGREGQPGQADLSETADPAGPAGQGRSRVRDEGAGRRAAELVGPLLPTVSADDMDLGWGDWRLDHSNDDRIRAEVPPHHVG